MCDQQHAWDDEAVEDIVAYRRQDKAYKPHLMTMLAPFTMALLRHAVIWNISHDIVLVNRKCTG